MISMVLFLKTTDTSMTLSRHRQAGHSLLLSLRRIAIEARTEKQTNWCSTRADYAP